MPRRNKRADVQALPNIPQGFFDDVQGEYEITVTNYSGTKRIKMNGTQASCWTYCVEAGRRGGFGKGRWEPTDIKLLRTTSDTFAVI